MIINCALYYFTCGGAISEANSFIATKLGGLLDTTYNNVSSRATAAKVIVLGYPHLFTDEGKTCNVNFLTSGNEKKLNETGDKLDAKIKERAEAHGFTFVDPRSAWKPHAVCASEEWLNGQSTRSKKATTRTSKARRSSRPKSKPSRCRRAALRRQAESASRGPWPARGAHAF